MSCKRGKNQTHDVLREISEKISVSIFVIIIAFGLIFPTGVLGATRLQETSQESVPTESSPAETTPTETPTTSDSPSDTKSEETRTEPSEQPTETSASTEATQTETKPEDRPPIQCPPEQHPEGQSCVPNRPTDGQPFGHPRIEPPPGCRVERNDVGIESVICDQQKMEQKCPQENFEEMANQCSSNGGKPIRVNEGFCPSVRCEFSDFSKRRQEQVFNNFQPTSRLQNQFAGQPQKQSCPLEQEIRQTLESCGKIQQEPRVIQSGGCPVAICVQPQRPVCEPQPSTCTKGRPVYEFENGCPVTRCVGENEFASRNVQFEPPKDAYEKCAEQHNGKGELIITREQNGQVADVRCIGPSSDEDAAFELPEEIPESTELLGIALKLEQLKLELAKLEQQTKQMADNWRDLGNTGEQERMKRVSNMFGTADGRIEEIKSKIRDKLDSLTKNDLLDIKQDIKQIKDVLLKDALYLMLSQSDEVKEGFTVKLDDSKKAQQFREKKRVEFERRGFEGDDVFAEQMREFNKYFTTCQPYSFQPGDGQSPPTITIVGLEGDTCIVKAEQNSLEFGPPEGANIPESEKIKFDELKTKIKQRLGDPPYDMTCKFADYALGMPEKGPGDDRKSQCTGKMLELEKLMEEQFGGPGGPGKRGQEQFPQGFEGPGGCSSPQECETYCQQPGKEQECREAFSKLGGVPKEAFQRGEGIQRSGPGGCTSQEECQAYCSDPRNADECGIRPGGFGGQGFGGPQGGFRQGDFQNNFNPENFKNNFDQQGGFPQGGFQQKCPDGICDEAEQRDPNLCPQDCFRQPVEPQQTQPTEVPPTDTTQTEPKPGEPRTDQPA